MDARRFTLGTALTLIAAYLGGGISGAQWTIDAYNITFAVMLLTSGSLGDRFGRRRILRIGLLTFLAAALSTAVGPILGGVLTDALGWRYTFWLNAPVVLIALLVTYRYLPESRNPDASSIDGPGQTLAILGLGSMTIVLVEGRTMAPWWTAALAAVAVAGIARSSSPGVASPARCCRWISSATDGRWLRWPRLPMVARLGLMAAGMALYAGWVKRVPRGRALRLTDSGRSALADCFDVDGSWTSATPSCARCRPARRPIRHAGRQRSPTPACGS